MNLQETRLGKMIEYLGWGGWKFTWGAANVFSTDFFFEVSAGNVPGHTAVNVVGHDTQISNVLATVGNNIGTLQTYSTVADIDSISSSSALDLHDIVITGLDTNYQPVAPQTITLDGQNRVEIPIPLFRTGETESASGAGGPATAGILWVYADTPLVAGKPVDLTKIRDSVHRTTAASGLNVSYEHASNSVFTIPAGFTAFVVFGKTTVSDAKAMGLSFWASVEGRPFRMVHPISLKDNNYDYFFKLPGRIPEKTDLEVRAHVTSGTAIVSAAYDIVLIDNTLHD